MLKADILAQCMSTREEVPRAQQFFSKAVSLIYAWSLSVFSLLPVHRKLMLACLVRLRQGPKVSKRLVRPRVKKNPNHILLPADKAVSAETG